MKRPLSVTVISWFIIILNALSLMGAAMTLNDSAAIESMAESPIPVSIQHVLVFTGIGISIVCGLFMLRAANWARRLYISWNGAYLLVLLVSSPDKLVIIPAIVVYVIIIFFLLRRPAIAYFKGSDAGASAE